MDIIINRHPPSWVASLLLLAVSAAAAPHPDWQVGPVQTTQSPFSTSLAFDAAGQPAVSFRSVNSKSLIVSRFDGAGWLETVVDGTGDVGGYSSLAFDPDGHPAVSYYDHANSDLKFARFDGTTWRLETVDSVGSVGTSTSMAFNALGHPVIAYESFSNNDLKLAEWNGVSWTITNVPVSGLIGSYASLAFTPGGEPAIAYYDAGAGDLEYVVRHDGQWTMTPVDTVGSVGRHASLAFGGDGFPAIAYHDQTSGTLKFARLDGTTWTLETVDAAGVVGTDASLEFSPAGQPAISYFDTSNTALKYAEFDGAAWQIVTVSNDGSVGVFSSLAFSPQGQPWISFANSPTGVAVASRQPPRPAVTWAGPADGLWSAPANWDPQPPTPADGVLIPSGASVVMDGGDAQVGRLTLDGALRVTGGTLIIREPSISIGTLEVSAGAVEVQAAATTYFSEFGRLIIHGGTVLLAGETSVGSFQQTAGVLTMSGALNVAGTATWFGGSWSGQGIYRFLASLEIGGESADHEVRAAQVLTSAQATWTDGNVTLRDGAVWVHRGEQTFQWSSGGVWRTEDGSALRVQGRVVVAEDASMTMQGDSRWESNGSLEVTGGTYSFNTGTMYMQGRLTVQTNGQMQVLSGAISVEGGEFTSYGTVTMREGSVSVFNAGGMRIHPSSVWTLNGTGSIHGDSTTLFVLGGTLHCTSGTWVADGRIAVEPAGTLRVSVGQIHLINNVTVASGGRLLIEPRGTVVIVTSRLDLRPGSILAGSGQLALDSRFSVDASGDIYFEGGDGGQVRFDSPSGLPNGWYRDGQGMPWPCPNFGETCAGSTIVLGDSFDDYEGSIEVRDEGGSIEGNGEVPNAAVVYGQGSILTATGSGVFSPPAGSDLILQGSGRWNIAVRDPVLPPGPGMPGIDQIRSTHGVSIESGPSGYYHLALVTEAAPGVPGLLPEFDPSVPWSILLIQADGGLTMAPNSVGLDLGGWRNDRGFGHLGVEQRGNELHLVFTPSPFQTWLASFFTAAERADPAIGSFSADFDGDGESALMEFALGHHPRERDAVSLSGQVVFDGPQRAMRLALTFPAGPHGLKIELQSSADLMAWTTRAFVSPRGELEPGPDQPGHLLNPRPNGFDYVNDMNLSARQFFRLWVFPADPWWE